MFRDRRRVLRLFGLGSLWLVVGAGSNTLLGRALSHRFQRHRRLRPHDLPPIPWIGHC